MPTVAAREPLQGERQFGVTFLFQYAYHQVGDIIPSLQIAHLLDYIVAYIQDCCCGWYDALI